MRLWLVALLMAVSVLLIGPVAAVPSGAPVILGDETLFRIEAQVASFAPDFRAQVISDRITKLAKNTDISVDTITVVDNPKVGSTDLRAGDLTLITIVDADALAATRERDELARDYAEKIKNAINQFRKSYSFNSIIIGIVSTLGLTVAFVASLIGISRSTPLISGRLRRWCGVRIGGLRLFNTQILSADRVADLITEILRIVRFTLYLILVYIYINLVLSFFPWTMGLARLLIGYLKTAVTTVGAGVVDYLPSFSFLIVIIVITTYFLKLIRFFFAEIESGDIVIEWFYQEWAKPTYKLIQFLVLAFAVTVSFPYLPGSSTPAFQGVSIFLGVLVSLGSSSAISNIFAGIILTYTRGFLVGDRVQIADTVGDVVDKTLFVTRVRTIKNVVITIPNSAVLSSHIINFSAAGAAPHAAPLLLHTTVTLGYDIPWRTVYDVLIRAAEGTSAILGQPAPFVLQTSLDDFYVHYELNAYTEDPGVMARTYSELFERIQDLCQEAGIEILSPHFRALRDGSPP